MLHKNISVFPSIAGRPADHRPDGSHIKCVNCILSVAAHLIAMQKHFPYLPQYSKYARKKPTTTNLLHESWWQAQYMSFRSGI
eukprot:scaffold517870_cov22-Prasinocladus_malaysianus.AAC.1